MSVDRVMIPITIVITFVAIIPFLIGDYPVQSIWQEDDTSYVPTESQNNDELYFEQLDENVKDAKQTVRDLMAEHESNNP